MRRLLVTVDSLRYDAYDELMPETRGAMEWSHEAAFSTWTVTAGSFPAILGGVYADGMGLPPGTSLANELPSPCLAVTNNHLLTREYGYDEGFDTFVAPGSDNSTGGLKRAFAARFDSQSPVYRAAAGALSRWQSLTGRAARQHRPADEIIDVFEPYLDDPSWFIWMHLMEPHHPYEPDATELSRAECHALCRRVIQQNSGTSVERETVRRLYRQEVRELDFKLAELWNAIPDDTQVVFAADHGELLGEDGLWGHFDTPRKETLHVPLAGHNVPEPSGPVASTIDIPTLISGEPHGHGKLRRETAYADYGEGGGATIGVAEGEVRITDGVDPPGELDIGLANESDLKALGYLE